MLTAVVGAFAEITSKALQQIGNLAVRRGIGWLIATATERTRNSEREARKSEEREARIRQAVQALGDGLLRKAAHSTWSGGHYTTVSLGQEVLAAVTTLSAEYPDLIEPLGAILLYTNNAQPLDAQYALKTLMQPILRATASVLSPPPATRAPRSERALAAGEAANADAVARPAAS